MLVGDVRLDNRTELAELLSVPSVNLPFLSDSRLAQMAFDVWQEDSFAKLVGDFAIAIWDSRSSRLLLARDFLGNRPLHYHRTSSFFAFASMPVGLHALSEIAIKPNKDAIAEFLALLPEYGGQTFFEHIEKIVPGHFAIANRDGFSSEAYWVPPDDELRLKSQREYEEAIRVELDRAVAARLRGCNRDVATHLSAGLDSSTVTVTAARLLEGSGEVVAYTSVPRQGYKDGIKNAISDEGRLAAEVAARHSNIEHVLISASSTSPLNSLDQNYHLFGRPLPNLSNQTWANAILAHARRRQIGVLLTGEFGNLSFSYDGMAALAMMARRGRYVETLIATYALMKNGSRWTTLAAQLIRPFLPLNLWSVIQRAVGKSRDLTDLSVIDAEFWREFRNRHGDSLGDSLQCAADPRALRLSALRRVDPGNYYKGVLGGWRIDLRDPTSDRRLIELCLRIPPEIFLAGGIPRSLARSTFADRLPASIIWERRKGYQAADWHEGLTAARSQVDAEIHRFAHIDLAGELLDIERMEHLHRNWPRRGWNSERALKHYRIALLRGISAGHFIRKSYGSND